MGRLQALWPLVSAQKIPASLRDKQAVEGLQCPAVSRYRATSCAHAALLAAALLAGCVKQSDYEALQKENQQLQTRLDQASEQTRQAQAELVMQQLRVAQMMEVQAQLQKSQEQLRATQVELDVLKAEFEQFKTQRRSAMVGKKFPVLQLDGGRVIHEAQITAIAGDELSIRHQDGVLKVVLAAASDELRWEACYQPQDARNAARNKLIAEARALEARMAAEKKQPVQVVVASPGLTAVEALQRQLAAQRNQLNAEYQALAAKNSGALRGAVWDAARPEASPLLNSVSGSRAILGISRLQSQRDAILATLQQLRGMDPASR